ncbi:hypothetical protein [Agromyces cerinus]|uniref:Uncharacterized protein n=1 Tax=Agromyces cerinus subsp. cerinus TaxID=232089 RepID=A0A1N6ESX3_9MICO|nr:hypothetical protein [Agromyces cerinus]SIN86202.1 hypothetical protein SAMN05443544_1440 [Agromyces cerinus subsp. cerinus]
MQDSMPKRTLWWGIGLSVGGAVLATYVHPELYATVWLNTEPGQTALVLWLLAIDLLNSLVLPLGTALIAASLVMFYIRGRAQPVEHDRPKRWVLPEPTERGPER